MTNVKTQAAHGCLPDAAPTGAINVELRLILSRHGSLHHGQGALAVAQRVDAGLKVRWENQIASQSRKTSGFLTFYPRVRPLQAEEGVTDKDIAVKC